MTHSNRRFFPLLMVGSLNLSVLANPQEMNINRAVQIEIKNLIGHWFVVARIPSFLESGTQRVSVTYSQVEANLFTTTVAYDRGNYKQRSTLNMKSWFDDPGEYRYWRERFFGPITFTSYVVHCDSESMVLRSLNSKSFWLLSRSPQVTELQKSYFLEKTKIAKIDMQKIEWVNQLAFSKQ